MLLDGVQRHVELGGDLFVAFAGRDELQHFELAFGERNDEALSGRSAVRTCAGDACVEAAGQQPEVSEWDVVGVDRRRRGRGDEIGQQLGHRLVLVEEDAEVPLGRSVRDRVRQRTQTSRLVAGGGEGQGTQCVDLDAASGAVVGGRCDPEVLEDAERVVGPATGDEHAGQYEVCGLVDVARLVVASRPRWASHVAASTSPSRAAVWPVGRAPG